MHLFDNEPTEPHAAMVWNMQQEHKQDGLNDEDLSYRHVVRLRALYLEHPDLIDSAEAEFEKWLSTEH
jgi:hypothetical protein